MNFGVILKSILWSTIMIQLLLRRYEVNIQGGNMLIWQKLCLLRHSPRWYFVWSIHEPHNRQSLSTGHFKHILAKATFFSILTKKWTSIPFNSFYRNFESLGSAFTWNVWFLNAIGWIVRLLKITDFWTCMGYQFRLCRRAG